VFWHLLAILINPVDGEFQDLGERMMKEIKSSLAAKSDDIQRPDPFLRIENLER
jgi:hypothetical protein